jgi:hypothetical protein
VGQPRQRAEEPICAIGVAATKPPFPTPHEMAATDTEDLLRRAEEVRAMAALMVSPEAKLMCFAIARCYQRLAALRACEAEAAAAG